MSKEIKEGKLRLDGGLICPKCGTVNKFGNTKCFNDGEQLITYRNSAFKETVEKGSQS